MTSLEKACWIVVDGREFSHSSKHQQQEQDGGSPCDWMIAWIFMFNKTHGPQLI